MVYGAIVHQCEALKCTVIAIGGIEDHVHLLVGFPPTLAVSELVKKVKGTSSHLTLRERSNTDETHLRGLNLLVLVRDGGLCLCRREFIRPVFPRQSIDRPTRHKSLFHCRLHPPSQSRRLLIHPRQRLQIPR